MRPLRRFALGLPLFLLAMAIIPGLGRRATAAPGTPNPLHIPPKHFTMLIHGRYGSRFTTVYRDGKTWACATEALPYANSVIDPLKGLNWKDLEHDAHALGDPRNCSAEVTLEDTRSTPAKTLKGCLGSPAFVALEHKLNRVCRSE